MVSCLHHSFTEAQGASENRGTTACVCVFERCYNRKNPRSSCPAWVLCLSSRLFGGTNTGRRVCGLTPTFRPCRIFRSLPANALQSPLCPLCRVGGSTKPRGRETLRAPGREPGPELPRTHLVSRAGFPVLRSTLLGWIWGLPHPPFRGGFGEWPKPSPWNCRAE